MVFYLLMLLLVGISHIVLGLSIYAFVIYPDKIMLRLHLFLLELLPFYEIAHKLYIFVVHTMLDLCFQAGKLSEPSHHYNLNANHRHHTLCHSMFVQSNCYQSTLCSTYDWAWLPFLSPCQSYMTLLWYSFSASLIRWFRAYTNFAIVNITNYKFIC